MILLLYGAIVVLVTAYLGAGVGYWLGVMRDPFEVKCWREQGNPTRWVNMLATVWWWPLWALDDSPLFRRLP